MFVNGWTIPAAAQVAVLEEDRALELSEALAATAWCMSTARELGPRSRMLETIREFVAERLAARPDADQIGRRHAEFYRALAEQADRPLRRGGHGGWLARLRAEEGNLAAAVRWYLAYDPGPLPHLFRVLWLFWSQGDLLGQAQSWVEQFRPPARSTCRPRPSSRGWRQRWAPPTGDDTAALAARQRLAPLLAGIQDPFLHAICQLAMAWTLPITGDLAGALREVAMPLEELRGQDEPVQTAAAASFAGTLEMTLGHYDDALRHLREAHDLAVRHGADWLIAAYPVQLGILAILQGRLDEARPLLAEALDRSLAARRTSLVTLCLAAYARLALAEGDPQRAAQLEGAADGLRRRVGLSAWPFLRRLEADLSPRSATGWAAASSIKHSTPGSGLTQQQAVAIARDQPWPAPRRPEPPGRIARKPRLEAGDDHLTSVRRHRNRRRQRRAR